MSKENYTDLKNYIEGYWPKIYIDSVAESKTSVDLPNGYFAPSTELVEGFSFPHMYYWDTYFISQGLWGTEFEHNIVEMVDNMFDLIRRYGFVPNSNSFSHLSRTQPPFLAPLSMQIIDRLKSDDDGWINWAYDRIVEEYETVWMGTVQPHNRAVYEGLSRYYDSNVIHVLAEAESGWDYTTRFEDRCLDFLPIDLNCLLYMYETQLSQISDRLQNSELSEKWQSMADKRKQTINQLMWNESEKFFFDYDYKNKRHGGVISLAGYYALFTGLASEEQASHMVSWLDEFETEYGLTTTLKKYQPIQEKQWATPNGWAPLHDIIVDGLLRYGYEEDARRIARKWVNTVNNHWLKAGVIKEKYNIIDSTKEALNGVYPDQHGFGWTNGVTYKFIRMLEA